MRHTLNYIKSIQRVADHGEVFTPAWMVEAIKGCMTPWWRGSDARSGEPVG